MGAPSRKELLLDPVNFEKELILVPTYETEVWLKEKGLVHEDELRPAQDTLENLQKECYAQFGRNAPETLT